MNNNGPSTDPCGIPLVTLSKTSACIVTLYKSKGDKYECASFRGISLLSVAGKVYGKVMMRIREGTVNVICEE